MIRPDYARKGPRERLQHRLLDKDRLMVVLLLVVASALGLALSPGAGPATAGLLFQSELPESPLPTPTASPTPTDTPVPEAPQEPPTATPLPAEPAPVPTALPAEELPPTPTALPPIPTPLPGLIPPTPTAVPTAEPPIPVVPGPTATETPIPVLPLPAPLAAQPQSRADSPPGEPAPIFLDPVLLIDNLVLALGYLWLICGFVAVLLAGLAGMILVRRTRARKSRFPGNGAPSAPSNSASPPPTASPRATGRHQTPAPRDRDSGSPPT